MSKEKKLDAPKEKPRAKSIEVVFSHGAREFTVLQHMTDDSYTALRVTPDKRIAADKAMQAILAERW